MRTEDLYPSTSDCVLAPIAGGQEDFVLGCLEQARVRVQTHHTRYAYVDKHTGHVCAIGAVLAVDGFGPDGPDQDKPTRRVHHCSGLSIMLLSEEAKEAIDLLNEAALELHPEASQHVLTSWSGPLEWVNQAWTGYVWKERGTDDPPPDSEVKQEILRIYDHAITKRAGMLVH